MIDISAKLITKVRKRRKVVQGGELERVSEKGVEKLSR